MSNEKNCSRPDFNKKRLWLDHNPRLSYITQGRSGTIWFHNDLTSFDMWWEFGGGKALAIINIPTKQDWEKRTKLSLDLRNPILQFIAEQVIADRTSSSHPYEIGESFITIFM